MNIQCQECKSSCLRLDEIINGKCKYCGHDLFTMVFEDETESGVKLPCSGGLEGLYKLSNKWREDANDVTAHPQDETDFPKHDVAESLISCADELDILIKEIAT